MLYLSELVFAVFAGLFFYYFWYTLTKDPKTAPEPFPLPFIGHLHHYLCRQGPYKGIIELSKKYGKIFNLKLGFLSAVVISDPTMIREAFNNPDLNGKADLKSVTLLSDGKKGIVSSDGETWSEQRRFIMRHLRDFGFGRKSMENTILDEVKELTEGFKKHCGKVIDVSRRFDLAVLNSLWMIVTGQRYSHDDPKLTEILEKSHAFQDGLSSNPIVLLFPTLCEYFPRLTGWNKLLDLTKSLRSYFQKQVIEHKKTLSDGCPRDIIDVYLEEICRTTDEKSSFYKEAGDQNLLAVVIEMFTAGSETTSSTLHWSVLYLTYHSEIQRKLQKEIDTVVGNNRIPALADRANMPYTQAVIMEILRKSSLVSLGAPHNAMTDVEFHGYKIPKDTGIMLNIYGVHHDPEIWGDPENFRPERFIEENGQCMKNHNALLPFSIGKRVCLGESLARDSLFLFITAIFQRFEIKANPESQKLTLEPKIGFLLQPKPYTVIMKDRFE